MKLLERSVEELERTINVLENKVNFINVTVVSSESFPYLISFITLLKWSILSGGDYQKWSRKAAIAKRRARNGASDCETSDVSTLFWGKYEFGNSECYKRWWWRLAKVFVPLKTIFLGHLNILHVRVLPSSSFLSYFSSFRHLEEKLRDLAEAQKKVQSLEKHVAEKDAEVCLCAHFRFQIAILPICSLHCKQNV